MASAKGICYALNIPLITIPTTAIMANAAKKNMKYGEQHLIIPMIDARRMEVFCAIYNHELQCLQDPLPMVLDTHSFSQWLEQSIVYFTGSGTAKWKEICHHPNARFLPDEWSAADMIETANSLFAEKKFSSLAYATPTYSKEFYSTAKN
jgi:tRNA threonylcarbamoyladenosine biosynthesis protein TsaB